MLLIDDLLLLPARGLIGVFRRIHDLAQDELKETPEKLQKDLFNLQMALEIGEINKREYNKKEKIILEKFNQIS